jgi:hypothetical protein
MLCQLNALRLVETRVFHASRDRSGGGGGLGDDGGAVRRMAYAFETAARCTATSKRTRQRCRAPAVRGWTVCRFHGAGGGAPEGEANGAWKHGRYSKAAKIERLLVKRLLGDAISLRRLLRQDSRVRTKGTLAAPSAGPLTSPDRQAISKTLPRNG